MEHLVTIHSEVLSNFDSSVLERLAVALIDFANSDFNQFPPAFGSYGAFERNPQAMQAQIYKIHIALTERDINNRFWRYRNKPHTRKSDNFLVFNSHWAFPNLLQIIDIISPDAHKKADKLLPMLIERAEKFQDLSVLELEKLVWISQS